MLYVDLNQVMIANIMIHIHSRKQNEVVDENLIRHMVLNSLRSYVVKFKKEYGDVVICCDGSRSWRKDVFPLYKANRKKDREAMIGVDWNIIFGTLNKLRDELKTNFPYKVIQVDGAEADDIIAVLVKNIPEKSLILSSDKDFVQLQKYPHIKQYSSTLEKFITADSKNVNKHPDRGTPSKFLRELILRGDVGDGIPNFLSPDNCLVAQERQKPISQKNLDKWLVEDPDTFCTTETMKRGYKRNELLIDFDYIPEDVTDRILSTYGEVKKGDASRLLNYLIENRLRNLIERVQEFY